MEAKTEAQAAEPSAPSTALEELPEKRGLHTGEPAYKQFDPEMIKLIGNQLMPSNYTMPELYQVLQMCATYRLDPFSREIWAARMSGRDGGAGPISILIGRDGMLAIAERHPDFRGFRNDVVYEKDKFEYDSEPRLMPDGSYSHVRHSFGSPDEAQRGKLLGAYAEVYREGRPPVYFFAHLKEYEKGGERSPWTKQKSVMIRKCALVSALRLAYRVSGLYIADEMTNVLLESKATQAQVESGDAGVVDYGDDPWAAQRLDDLFGAAPGGYLPAKRRLMLAGLDEIGRSELIAQLEREIIDAGRTPPPPPDPADFAQEVVDEQVEDDGIAFGADAEEAEVVADEPEPTKLAATETIPVGPEQATLPTE